MQIADPTLGNGSIPGTCHFGIDASINQMIQGRSRTSHQRNTQIAEDQDIPWHHPGRSEKHTDQGAQQHQQNDTRFTHLEVVTPSGSQFEFRSKFSHVNSGLGHRIVNSI
jgi:hypothetical protein